VTFQPESSGWLWNRRHQILAAGALAVLVVGVLAIVLLVSQRGGGSTPAQKRAAFTSMVTQLRADLRECSGDAAAAVSAYRLAEAAGGSRQQALESARKAAAACVPDSDNGIWNLSLYVIPSQVRSRNLDYALSCLGVWAQFDVAPAMKDIEIALGKANDAAAVSAYMRLAKSAVNIGTAAESALRHDAHQLHLTKFQSILLPSLQPAS
jgi:hypothetical protein